MSGDAKVMETRVLAKGWRTLSQYLMRVPRRDGGVDEVVREVYDCGDAAAILLYDPDRDTVLLVRQFRPPLFIAGEAPMLIEAVAGLLDDDAPEACARREAGEEAGVRVGEVVGFGRFHMSPGSVRHAVNLFAGTYNLTDRVGPGGGLAAEGEDIELIELPFAEARAMALDGRITDAKTQILILRMALDNPFARR